MHDLSLNPESQGTGFKIEFKRVLYRALRYWYLVALSFLIGLTAAYLINRYATRIYTVTASIIIKESEERPEAKLLFNNPLANPYRNFYNEPFIMSSIPLMSQVIESLNFHVIITKEGNIKTTEQYKNLPFEISLLGNTHEINPASFELEILPDGSFVCTGLEAERKNQSKSYLPGDTVNCKGNLWMLQLKDRHRKPDADTYKVSFRRPEDLAVSYANRVKITWSQQGASLLDLSITGPIAQKEKDFLNKLIEIYSEADLQKKRLAADRTIAFIDNQLQLIQDSLVYAEGMLQRFKQQHVLTDLGAEAQRLYQQMDALQQQLSALLVAENYYRYLEDYLNRELREETAIFPSSLGINDGLLNNLVVQLVELQTEINSEDLAGSQNPRIQANYRKIAELRGQIISSTRNLRDTDRIRKAALNTEIAKLQKQLNLLPEAERIYVNIRRNYALSESMYLFLMQKRSEAGISQAATISDVQIVNPPRQAGGHIAPSENQNLLVLGGIGLALPFLLFILAELLNNKIQSREDIEKISSIPFNGGIGHKESTGNLVVIEKPRSAIAEAFRALRANLNYFTEGKEQKVFMITSSLSGEGKTFTTINLASVFALSGKPTLIIGADLRKPRITEEFGLQNRQGLSNYLSGQCSLQEAIQPTGIEHLHILPGGPVPPNPSELIMQPRMAEMLQELKKSYAFILLDTPPLALITDGLVLSKYADHTLYLVRQDFTPREMLFAADELYQAGKIPHLSFVLNDIKKTGPGYGYGYRYGYGYGYGYGGYGYWYGYPDKKRKGGGNYKEE